MAKTSHYFWHKGLLPEANGVYLLAYDLWILLDGQPIFPEVQSRWWNPLPIGRKTRRGPTIPLPPTPPSHFSWHHLTVGQVNPAFRLILHLNPYIGSFFPPIPPSYQQLHPFLIYVTDLPLIYIPAQTGDSAFRYNKLLINVTTFFGTPSIFS